MSDNPYRLPRSVLPTHYRLRLEPDLAGSVFKGTVEIEVGIVEPIYQIVLNAVELDLSSAEIDLGAGPLPLSVSLDEASQRATLSAIEVMPPGNGVLSIEFGGVLNDQLHGFYRSSFTDVTGVDQLIATTQFEATDARRAFPCFDEPDFKASFGITLVVPGHLFAVSNGAEVARREVGDGRVEITYADTMRMSTYLVAFVVGPFEATDVVDVDGVPLRVIAPTGKSHLTEFALECGEFCLRYLSEYYAIPYPGDKVDLVAVPDFAFGAMENLGCITFRETALLVDPTTATQAELVRILDVIAHELAHMWFGDLVTMGWWDGIWLNEAFATFMEMKATDAMKPEWRRWVSFGAVERPWAFAVDALASTRPVEFEVKSPEEANEMFDALTYGKGSSVLRMIEQFLGEEVFRRGVGEYLERHSYGNTVTSDLWEGLDQASGSDVGAIMDTWILQGGFPQVEVTVDGSGIRIAQRRYLAIPDETDQTLWRIPLQLRGSADGVAFDMKILLGDASTVVGVDGSVDWLVANAGGHGFYRASYDSSSYGKAVSVIPDLAALERFVLIDDAWAFVESGQLPVSQYLELATAYRNETEHSVWSAVVGGLGAIRHHVATDDHLGPFRALVGDLVGPMARRYGWDPSPDESDLDRRLRGLLLGALGRLADDAATIERSNELAVRWVESQAGIDPDVGQAALFTWAAHGDIATLDRLFHAYKSANTPQTELKLLQAMTFVDSEEAVDRMLAAIIDGSVRSQDSAWIVARLMSGRSSGAHLWQQLRTGWSEITSKMPPMTLRRMIEGIPALSQPGVANDVAAYFAETDLPMVAKSVAQNLEKLKTNRLLRERETEALSDYLNRADRPG
jgi:puromycin-sensitive aminopeptidase